MIDFLADTPILLLVLVSALGYLLGQLTIKGSSLGVAAVLFVGLAFGALDPRLKLPEFTTLLGLILFVYAVGLSSGPGFVAALRRKGLRDNTYVVGILAAAALGVAGLATVLGLTRTVASGLFAGSLTNTPALAPCSNESRRRRCRGSSTRSSASRSSATRSPTRSASRG